MGTSEYNFHRDAVKIGRPGLDSSDDHVQVDNCSIIGRRGERCDAPVSDDTKVSICDFHAARVYHDLTSAMLRDEEDRRSAARAGVDPRSRAAEVSDMHARRRAASVVYYVSNRGTIKIGRTINLKQRLNGLRIDPKWLLAIEPGDFRVESERLKQFSHLRYGRTEDFDPGDELIAHIRELRHQYGPPKLELDPFGLVAQLDAS